MSRFLLISLGAILGANARYLVGLWAAQRLGEDFPYGTAIVNITGSFILSFLVAWGGQRGGLSPELRLLIAVGFVASYTTFSSFTVESLLQIESAGMINALLNILVNNVVGFAAAWIGMVLAKSMAAL
jgi:CrcB protein